MDYETGIRLERIEQTQQELIAGINVVLKVLEEYSPDKYKKAIDKLKKESEK